jgi:hypothetical protein
MLRRVLLLIAGVVALLGMVGFTPPQTEGPFGNHSLRGTWGFSASGVLDGIGAGNAVGLYTFDGRGGCTFSETLNLSGIGSFPRTAEACTYSVNEDGTGTATRTFADASTSDIAFVIIHRGRELHFIVTDKGTVVNGVARLQRQPA